MFRPLKGGKENADFDLKIINSDIKVAKISLVLLILFLAMFILMAVGEIIVSAH